MGNAKGKASKNNPDVKTKDKNNKIHDSEFCLKCKEHEDCKEFQDYLILLLSRGTGRGCVCKRGK